MKKLFNDNIFNIFTIIISIFCSIQFYLFETMNENKIKILKLKSTTMQMIQQHNFIKEKIEKLKRIENNINKINIKIAEIKKDNKYLIKKIENLSKILIYKKRRNLNDY